MPGDSATRTVPPCFGVPPLAELEPPLLLLHPASTEAPTTSAAAEAATRVFLDILIECFPIAQGERHPEGTDRAKPNLSTALRPYAARVCCYSCLRATAPRMGRAARIADQRGWSPRSHRGERLLLC